MRGFGRWATSALTRCRSWGGIILSHMGRRGLTSFSPRVEPVRMAIEISAMGARLPRVELVMKRTVKGGH